MSAFGPFSIEHFFDLDSFERDQEERLASSGHSGQSPEADSTSDITIDSSPCPSPTAVIPFQEDVLLGTSDLEVGKADTYTLLLTLHFGHICSSFAIQQEPICPASTAEYMILQAAKCDEKVAYLMHKMKESYSVYTLYTSLLPFLFENNSIPSSLEYRRLRSLQLNEPIRSQTYISACVESVDRSMLIHQMGLPHSTRLYALYIIAEEIPTPIIFSDPRSTQHSDVSLFLSQSFPTERTILTALKSDSYGGAYRTYQHFHIIQRLCACVGLDVNSPSRHSFIHLSSHVIVLTTEIILSWAGLMTLGTFNNQKGVISRIHAIFGVYEKKYQQGQLPARCVPLFTSMKILQSDPLQFSSSERRPAELDWTLQQLKDMLGRYT
ncbi:hypothetical protein PILCRDRAFT_3741 [Piloderma croceum F 1598]|uniref:Uncharacterized protein n=1 Tax=Piloderma croceum (strain F 1598) TaxID=765440 RepID=A0A0C3BNI9_PILCF|nr:hypothetical protein PILCRDRAFT_3741 [Piloderma croceum F 1598]